MKFVAVTICALLLAGCGNASGMDTNETTVHTGDSIGSGDLAAFRVPLKDGRAVTCVVYDGYKAGGLSCDWANVK